MGCVRVCARACALFRGQFNSLSRLRFRLEGLPYDGHQNRCQYLCRIAVRSGFDLFPELNPHPFPPSV